MPLLTASSMQFRKKSLYLVFIERKIPWSQSCTKDIFIGGKVNAKNIIFHKKFRRGVCGPVV
jgi:hypothetical protein